MIKTPTVNCPSQETEVTSTPTRPVDNVVIATKGLQDRNTNIIAGTKVENKGKLIQTQVSLTKFLQSEVKIIHIIVQDQDGQNNNNA